MQKIIQSARAGLLALAIAAPAMASTDNFRPVTLHDSSGGITFVNPPGVAVLLVAGKDVTFTRPAVTRLTAAMLPTGESVPVAAVSPAVSALSPGRGQADARMLPVSILGQNGGSELLGATVTVGLVLRYARNRRLV